MTRHDLDAIIQGGESYTVEFKRNVNSDLSKELTAFANSSGGRIFIGVEDNGEIHGVQVTNELKARIQSMARECDPAIEVELEVFDNLMIIHVPEGKDKPHRCTNGFYIRSGASCAKLGTYEIMDFGKAEGKICFDKLRDLSVRYPDVLDEAAIMRYIRISGISAVTGTDQLLTNLGVLYNETSGPVLNKAGVLFFAKQPARIMPHCVITCLLFKGNTNVHILDRKSFEFDLLTNIDEALLFIERHLNLAYEIKTIRRKEILEIPEFVLREAIINAVAHRDYFEDGANIQVNIFDNRVEITNPGGLPKGLKPENFGKLSVTRNSLIAELLHRCNYIEKAGTGIRRMQDGMKEAGLLAPEFDFSGFFVIILRRPKPEYELPVTADRKQRMLRIMKKLLDNSEVDFVLLSKELNVSGRSIRRDLEMLEQIGWVKSTGTTRDKQHSLTEEGVLQMNKTF